MFVDNLFSDRDPSAIDERDDAADGIRLVDTAADKLYLVASDGYGKCLCTRGLAGVVLEDNAPFQIPTCAVFARVPRVPVLSPSEGILQGC